MKYFLFACGQFLFMAKHDAENIHGKNSNQSKDIYSMSYDHK